MRERPADRALRDSCQRLLARIHQLPDLRVESVRDLPLPHQGASGATVQLLLARWRSAAGAQGEDRLACKHASQRERRVMHMLDAQGQAVPPSQGPPDDCESPSHAPLLMAFARSRPPERILGDPYVPLTQGVAQGLARIHAANRQRRPAWLPRAADDYTKNINLLETQQAWQRCMTDARFRRAFGHLDGPLRESRRRLLDFLAVLEEEDECLTLINTDLHPDHIRLYGDRPVFIDWEQACYGPLYLDLVNYFTLETATLYRDALAAAGFAIPTATFMQRFRTAGLYMGLRYLEVGLLHWLAGGEAWRQGRWFFHYCLSMALGGR